MLLAICTTQVKQRVKRDFKKENNKVTKYVLKGDSNPDPQNQLELKVQALRLLFRLNDSILIKFLVFQVFFSEIRLSEKILVVLVVVLSVS